MWTKCDRLAVPGADARVHPPRLEVAADRAGRDLAEGLLARHPDLDVVGLLGGEAHVAGAERHDRGRAGRASSARPRRSRACARAPSADCSGVVIETSSTLVNWCWRSMPRVSRPAEPASARKHGVRAVKRRGSSSSRRMLSRTRLVRGTSAVGMSQCSPCLELVVRELRQLRRAEHRLVAHQERRRHLRVAVLARVQVEHELPERPLQPGELALEHHEARAGHPGGGLEIHQAARPRRARNAACRWRVAGACASKRPVLDVAVLVGALRHVRVRAVRDRGEPVVERLAPPRASAASSAGASSFRRATSAISSCARASSLAFLAAADLLGERVAALLVGLRGRDRGLARVVQGDAASAASGASPRRRRASSKASGFSRMARMSCMGSARRCEPDALPHRHRRDKRGAAPDVRRGATARGSGARPPCPRPRP